MKPLRLRAAVEDDLPFLLQLRLQTMNEHLIASGASVSSEVHLQRVQARFECAQIVTLEDRPIGLLKAVREGPCWELMQIQISPPLQGQGLGRRLVQQVIDDARKAGASLKLSVLKKNPARRLYERLGFTVVAEHDRAYDMLLEAS